MALYVLMARSIQGGSETGRVAAQVVSGMGFLGGGVILREGMTVRGLTTAATLWCAAAVGTLCGCLFLRHAALAAAGIVLTNSLLNPVSRWLDKHAAQRSVIEAAYRVKVVCKMSEERRIRRPCWASRSPRQKTMLLRGIGIHAHDHGHEGLVVADVEMRAADLHILQDIVAQLNADPDTISTSWERQSERTCGTLRQIASFCIFSP